MHICFVAEGYPTPDDPIMVFVKNYVEEMVRQGVQCSVIAPQSLTRAVYRRRRLRARFWQDSVEGSDSHIDVYQPLYITFSLKTASMNRKLFAYAAKRAYKKISDNVDALYGEFWNMAVTASKFGGSKPLFLECGESYVAVREWHTDKEIERMLSRLTGVVYVSTKTYNESVAMKLQSDRTPYIILPNGFDGRLFYKQDREACRKRLNWPDDALIVSFVGGFNHQKGSLRLSEALREINKDKTVYSCFIGSGADKPDCPNMLYADKLAHDKLCDYLCASDIFILPTTNEGCANAIVEAMACGLPVISSKGAFNDDILSDANSVRIDPMSVEELKNAILTLIGDPERRESMSRASLKAAESLKIGERIKKLIAFLEENI